MEKEYQKIGNVFKFDEKFRTIVGLNEPYETLKNIIAEVLQVDPDEISMDTTFDDLGGDSLDLYQIILEVQDKLSVEVDEEKVAEIKTVGEAVELIQDAE